MNRVWVVALAALVSASGCFHVRFKNPNVVPGTVHERWTAHFLFGVIGDEVVDAREFCGTEEVSEVTTGTSVATWLISVFSLGIFSPNKVTVRCGAGPMPSASQADGLQPIAEVAR
jgi:hypothetical protein